MRWPRCAFLHEHLSDSAPAAWLRSGRCVAFLCYADNVVSSLTLGRLAALDQRHAPFLQRIRPCQQHSQDRGHCFSMDLMFRAAGPCEGTFCRSHSSIWGWSSMSLGSWGPCCGSIILQARPSVLGSSCRPKLAGWVLNLHGPCSSGSSQCWLPLRFIARNSYSCEVWGSQCHGNLISDAKSCKVCKLPCCAMSVVACLLALLQLPSLLSWQRLRT